MDELDPDQREHLYNYARDSLDRLDDVDEMVATERSKENIEEIRDNLESIATVMHPLRAKRDGFD